MYSNRVWNRICMGKAISMEALMIVLFLLCLLLAWAALIYRKREKKLKISILQMLEEASSGFVSGKDLMKLLFRKWKTGCGTIWKTGKRLWSELNEIGSGCRARFLILLIRLFFRYQILFCIHSFGRKSE